jgi:uncharacterized protein YbjT (DUF2867 family)
LQLDALAPKERAMKIAIIGATGLVGGLTLPKLSGHAVTSVGRREVAGVAQTLTGDAPDWPALMTGLVFDVAISTLGTTQKIAGSKDAFAAVDRDAVIGFAQAAKACGARQFIVVTAVGSNASSSNFYQRIKGEAENGLRAIGFDRLDIIRPGLLRGNRTGPARTFESLFIAASPLTDLLTPRAFDQYRSVAADDVAAAIAALCGRAEAGTYVHHNRDIWSLAA